LAKKSNFLADQRLYFGALSSYNKRMNKSRDYELKWPPLGNNQATDFLGRTLAAGKIASAYVFVGPDDVGKTTIASCFAASLLCLNFNKAGALPCGTCQSCRQNQVGKSAGLGNDLTSVHPDFHILKRLPDKKNIGIEQIRDFIRELELSSFLNSYKIGIIKQAESLSDEAANALLKTLEEPKNKVVIILSVKELSSIPATIASRAQIVRFYPVKTEIIYHFLINEYGTSRSQALHLSRLCLGRPALAVKFLQDENFLREYQKRVDSFLNFSSQPIYQRFQVVGELLGEKATGQEAVRRAERILETWQGVMRDVILANFNHQDLIQHESSLASLERVARTTPPERLISWFGRLDETKQYLRANVGPRQALEQLVSSI
jgi:DNA polymerase-3 subunit delta'